MGLLYVGCKLPLGDDNVSGTPSDAPLQPPLAPVGELCTLVGGEPHCGVPGAGDGDTDLGDDVPLPPLATAPSSSSALLPRGPAQGGSRVGEAKELCGETSLAESRFDGGRRAPGDCSCSCGKLAKPKGFVGLSSSSSPAAPATFEGDDPADDVEPPPASKLLPRPRPLVPGSHACKCCGSSTDLHSAPQPPIGHLTILCGHASMCAPRSARGSILSHPSCGQEASCNLHSSQPCKPQGINPFVQACSRSSKDPAEAAVPQPCLQGMLTSSASTGAPMLTGCPVAAPPSSSCGRTGDPRPRASAPSSWEMAWKARPGQVAKSWAAPDPVSSIRLPQHDQTEGPKP
mmetsp:Transcript_135137/g.431915  ORF Transcript_135137/g.431915 Transcript_135137/m.431915 type:complete len:345 (+) Transcript_135137:277-1311(+)